MIARPKNPNPSIIPGNISDPKKYIIYVRNTAPEISPEIIFQRLFARRSLFFIRVAPKFIIANIIIMSTDTHITSSLRPFTYIAGERVSIVPIVHIL